MSVRKAMNCLLEKICKIHLIHSCVLANVVDSGARAQDMKVMSFLIPASVHTQLDSVHVWCIRSVLTAVFNYVTRGSYQHEGHTLVFSFGIMVYYCFGTNLFCHASSNFTCRLEPCHWARAVDKRLGKFCQNMIGTF